MTKNRKGEGGCAVTFEGTAKVYVSEVKLTPVIMKFLHAVQQMKV
jgi:hypothetical protein